MTKDDMNKQEEILKRGEKRQKRINKKLEISKARKKMKQKNKAKK